MGGAEARKWRGEEEEEDTKVLRGSSTCQTDVGDNSLDRGYGHNTSNRVRTSGTFAVYRLGPKSSKRHV